MNRGNHETPLVIFVFSSAGATVIASLLLLLPAAAGLLSSGVPRSYCPLPALTVIPAFLLSSRGLESTAIVLPSLLFLVWNPALLRGQVNLPTRSYWLMAILTVLSFVYFVSGWKLGVAYEGIKYTGAVCLINFVWIVLLNLALIRARKGCSFRSNLLLHWILFAWLAWYAFPYLGELP